LVRPAGRTGSTTPSRTRSPRGFADGFGATVGFDDPAFGAAEDSATISRLLRVLTERERELLVAKFYVGLTQDELANALGISRGTVSSAISRAAARFRAGGTQ